jgi:hypothetical protein
MPRLKQSLRNMIPAAIRVDNQRLIVGWSVPLRSIYTTPMYDWTIDSTEFLFTDAAVLEEYADAFDDAKVRGIIFHMSRCGSTAIANAFRETDRTLVLSESAALSRIVRGDEFNPLQLEPSQRITLARGFLAAVLKEFPSNALVIKMPSFASWDVGYVASLFPNAPWLFSSRAPGDVMASLESSPSRWHKTISTNTNMIHTLGFTPETEIRIITARILTRFLTSSMSAANARAHFLDYAELTADTVSSLVYTFLNIEPTPERFKRVEQSLTYYSKSLNRRPFEKKNEPSVSSGVRELDEIYEKYLAFIAARRHRAA